MHYNIENLLDPMGSRMMPPPGLRPNLSSALCDLDLCLLAPRLMIVSCSCPGTTCADYHQSGFICFQNIVDISLVNKRTDEGECAFIYIKQWTNERTCWEHLENIILWRGGCVGSVSARSLQTEPTARLWVRVRSTDVYRVISLGKIFTTTRLG